MKFDFLNVPNKEKYRLYIMALERKNFAIAMNERFQRITPTRILLYTKKRYTGFSEVTDETIFDELSKEDREWLFGCNLTIINEHVQRHPNKLKEAQSKFLEELSRELDLIMQEELADGRKDD